MQSETNASRLHRAALERLQLHLPTGVGVKISVHGRWTTLQRTTPESVEVDGRVHEIEFDSKGRPQSDHFGGTIVGKKLGSWLPLLPVGLRRRLAAQDAVETILAVTDPPPRSPGATADDVDYDVRARNTAKGVAVSYQPIDTPDRIELAVFPTDLF